ncbi:MAG: flagellar basal body P-ring formation chaperone FlgA [Gemmatimonadaceae bacterium]
MKHILTCATILISVTQIAHVHIASAQSATPNATLHVQRVAIATHDLARGSVLSAADMKWTDTTGVTASSSDTARITAGWIARRSIRTGEILREPGVSRPDLVSSGDAVEVVYSTPEVTISVRGTAIGSGRQGDPVYVKLDNRKRLRGVVTAANTVRVM